MCQNSSYDKVISSPLLSGAEDGWGEYWPLLVLCQQSKWRIQRDRGGSGRQQEGGPSAPGDDY